MAILTREAILVEIEDGRIGIDPFDPDNLGPASYDLTLGNLFRIYRKTLRFYEVTEDADANEVTELIEVPNSEFILLSPNESIHGMTKERITLPDDICGWLEGRSRFARLGLLVHISASFMQPGIDNHQVLELSDVATIPLAIYPGTKVCQFIFARCEGRAQYRGRYRSQTAP